MSIEYVYRQLRGRNRAELIISFNATSRVRDDEIRKRSDRKSTARINPSPCPNFCRASGAEYGTGTYSEPLFVSQEFSYGLRGRVRCRTTSHWVIAAPMWESVGPGHPCFTWASGKTTNDHNHGARVRRLQSRERNRQLNNASAAQNLQGPCMCELPVRSRIYHTLPNQAQIPLHGLHGAQQSN